MATDRSVREIAEAYLAHAATLPTGGRALVPEGLDAGPEAERVEVACELIRRHRARELDGPTYFAAEAAWTAILEALAAPSEGAVCTLAHAVGATGGYLCAYPWRFVWKAAQTRVARHGVTPALHDALRAMAASMRSHISDKNAAVAIDRTLWFETFSELDEDRCAADRVRRDLRRLAPARFTAWRRLLLDGMKVDRAEPKPAWDKKAAKAIGAIADLDARAREWLGASAARDEVRLSPAGADALRAIIWASAPTADVGASLRALAARPWKRGKDWGPRQDRFVGAIAWGLAAAKVRGARPALEALQARFGKTTAKYAIAIALEAAG